MLAENTVHNKNFVKPNRCIKAIVIAFDNLCPLCNSLCSLW